MTPAGGRPGVQHGSLLVSCCVLGSRLSLGHGCEGTAARDRAGKAVRTAAVPARAVLERTGGRSTPNRPGSPGPPGRTLAFGGLGVSRESAARRENSWASRPMTRSTSKKHLGRRRFAPAQPGSEYSRFEGRRDGNAADTRPRAGEVFRGERTVAPCPVKTVRWAIEHTNDCLAREVCWVLPLGSAVVLGSTYTWVEPAQASVSPTVARDAGRTNGGRPSHEELARRQTQRTPGLRKH